MEADVVSLGGDSGGTWWYNGVLIGIHRSGDGASFARFSHISNAKAYGGIGLHIHQIQLNNCKN